MGVAVNAPEAVHCDRGIEGHGVAGWCMVDGTGAAGAGQWLRHKPLQMEDGAGISH